MGTEPQYGTSLELYYKPPTSDRVSCRNRAKNNIGVNETIKNQEKFGLEFDEDLTQIPIYLSLIHICNYSFWYESSQLARRQQQNHKAKAEEK